jgi:FtsP/CotA-like multicopper oxidase with cupredoxin domain
MADMGHGGVGHDMGATGTVASPTTKPAGDSHGGHSMPPQKPAAADPHASHNMPAQKPAAADPHAAHEPAQQPKTPDPHAGHNMTSMDMQSHPSSEQGNPLVDMQTMMPTARLDDPGIGLRENGRRVLTYADLRSVFDDPDGREPGRTIELHLTGHMDRFVWSFNGLKFSHAAPIELV